MRIVAVSNPVYSKPDNSMIDCIVTFEGGSLNGQTHPYTTAAWDYTDYGQALWEALQAGTYGAIGAYVATPRQSFLAAMAAGVIITSTTTPALNGTYSIDFKTQAKINSVATYIMLNSAFPPASSSSIVWYDISGNAHTFTSISDFKNFANVIADFVAHIDIYASSNGEIGSIPSNAFTIP